MKKIMCLKIMCFLIMAIASVIPIYYIVFWEPQETSSVSSINVQVVDYMTKENGNIEQLRVGEEVNTNLLKNEEAKIKPILRVAKEQIQVEMCEEDKNRLKDILFQLSTVDLNRLEEILKNEDQNQATKDIISLLKKRLSLRDYKEIEKILVPYINFDSIS